MSVSAARLGTLLTRAADRDAGAPGLVAPDESLTHGELADRVSRFSALLAAHGVRPGDRVALFAPKSALGFVAVHGALHAGAIAMPIDPMAPASLVADIVAATQPSFAVLHPATAGRWPETSVIATLGAPDHPRAVPTGAELEIDPVGPHSGSAADPAYLITTSGSTGRPKGILHSHASGHRYAELAVECYGLGPGDRMANVAPFHFDQSTFELYAAPLAGAATVLVPDAVLRFPASVAELVERERVTTWYSVPTILRQLLERGGLEGRDLSDLRWVLFGGEVFAPEALRRLMELLPAARFSNVYGPAEVNQCTYQHLDDPPGAGDPVPIGRAWADTELRLVADDGHVLEGAASGELQVRTATAMVGYWEAPELTQGSFTGEPGDHGARWYRTGDLVERDETGCHHFRGRVDRQVKVRGVRIELEAVEAAMGALAGVSAAAAVVTGEEPTLVGVVESSTVDEAEVRGALAARLDPAAVPDRVIVVDLLPRTGSGKVDATAAAALVGAPA